ncbi:RTA1 like protein [Aspergillus steynii IBT 23096]|uniref:RTA1 like protein n=1 Tax=Aspergillus steynii IBT 23096 TaxID=1392250 RepID=A0A2I2FWW7_9EURO|nr:RTA1 like protein [Aspergillus steynii IBT 23096]PLB45131.1 RTA1 like protein [Aspergillus steynii IBT 23096]
MPELQSYKGYYLWQYVPSRAAAVIFLLLFLGATAFHVWKIWKLKTWFCICFAIGGFFEFIGYCARASAYDKTGRMMPFCIQNTFILLGPALFAASVYMVLGRIITAVRAEHHSLIRVNWLTKIFVLGDVLSFVVQGGAAGMMVSSDLASMGNNIVIAGLLIQVIMFGLFIVTAILFQMRMQKSPTTESFNAELPWKSHLGTLYMVSLLIMVRSIFRVVEFIMGHDGYLLSHEWTLYIFDALLMWIAMVLFGYRYPGDLQAYLHHPEAVRLCDVQTKA